MSLALWFAVNPHADITAPFCRIEMYSCQRHDCNSMFMAVITPLLLLETRSEMEISGGGEPRWMNMIGVTPLSCSHRADAPLTASVQAWWHLYQGARLIGFACFKRGQSNLIPWTDLNQICLFNWIPCLKSWEQVFTGEERTVIRDEWAGQRLCTSPRNFLNCAT